MNGLCKCEAERLFHRIATCLVLLGQEVEGGGETSKRGGEGRGEGEEEEACECHGRTAA